MSQSAILGQVMGAQNLERLRTAIFNYWGVKAYGISVDSRDTVFRYQVQTDKRLTANEARLIPVYVKGFVAALEAVQ